MLTFSLPVSGLVLTVNRRHRGQRLDEYGPRDIPTMSASSSLAVARWFRPPFRLAAVHSVLILFFMLALHQGWTDFPQGPYDCVYLPYLFLSGPVVHLVAHAAQHRADAMIDTSDVNSIRLAWNVIPGFVCLILGGIQWWLVESAYMSWLRRLSGRGCEPNSTLTDHEIRAAQPRASTEPRDD